MFSKLVKLDPNNGWGFSEVDPIRLARTANALKDFVDKTSFPEDDKYEIRAQVIPLCIGALNGTVKLPLSYSELPLKQLSREGLLSRDFSKVWSDFCVTATGTPLEETKDVEIDGVRFAYMEFEDPGDWPELVLRRSEERRLRRLSESE